MSHRESHHAARELHSLRQGMFYRKPLAPRGEWNLSSGLEISLIKPLAERGDYETRTILPARELQTWLVAFSLAICTLFSGCALFRSPDPNDIPKSRYDAQAASFTDSAPDPNQQKPLLDWDQFKKDNVRRNYKTLIGKGPSKEVAQKSYEKARAAYEEARVVSPRDDAARANFVRAATEFTAAADRWPDSSLEQDALFMAGESNFFAERYVEANRSFELLLKKYPNTRHIEVVEARRFVIAKFWLLANDKEPYPFYQFNITDQTRPWYDTRGHALRVFDKMKVDDPTGKLADDAVMAHANEMFQKKEYERADQFYTDLIKAYPESEHQFDAHYLGLKSKLNSYRGSDYSGDSLDEAEKLIKQMRRQFPREAAKEREYLDRSFSEIRYKKAERNWKMAEYYDRRGEYGGSKYYYGIVMREYDDTSFAERSQQRMQEIADMPDVPTKPLKWLADWFPESDKLKPILQKAMVDPKSLPGSAPPTIRR